MTRRTFKKITFPKLSPGEEALAQHMDAVGIKFEREVEFHPARKWRFDFVIVKMCNGDAGRMGLPYRNFRVAVEVEGGGHGGAHSRPKGFAEDCEKYNAAAILGWRLLRFTTRMVESGIAIKTIEEILAC